jgi:hypothetical protein
MRAKSRALWAAPRVVCSSGWPVHKFVVIERKPNESWLALTC